MLHASCCLAQSAYEAQSAALAQRMTAMKSQAALYSNSVAKCGNINFTPWNRIYIDPHFCRRDREVLAWWNQKLAEPQKTDLKTIAMPDISNLRMIAQVVSPRTETGTENQTAELGYFKSIGFNGALLVWKGESPEDLAKIAKGLQAEGWILAWTFGPEEDNESRNYVDPDKYREACRQILPYCAFAIPAWRKATLIHGISSGDETYANKYRAILTSLIREVNPMIPVMGETTLRNVNGYKLIKSAHAGTSGNIVFEATYKEYLTEKVIKYMRQQQIAEPYLFLLIGPRCYSDTDRTYIPQDALAYNLATATVINQNKEAAVVMAGGGGGTRELWGAEVSDDLTKSNWRQSR
jgi:hypothetical protein